MAKDRRALAGHILETIPVTKQITLLRFDQGNVTLFIGKDGTLMVDSQFRESSAAIQKKILELGGKEANYLINTHWHDDHVEGNEFFGKSATIIAHRDVRKTLSTYQELIGLKGEVQKFPPKEEYALPEIVFDTSLSIFFNGDEIRVIHFPYGADTSGDSIVWFVQSGVVATGDVFYTETFPWVDFDRGGDAIGRANTLHDLIELIPPETKILSGHGTLAGVKELKVFYAMIRYTLLFVKERMDDGKTLKEIQTEGLPKEYQRWESPDYVSCSLWIEFLFKSWQMGKTRLISERERKVS
jgi:cyclase